MTDTALTAEASAATVYYVSPAGDDAWSGTLSEPAAARADGPFATIGRAQQAVRALRAAGELTAPVRVLVRGGVYRLDAPLRFDERDSGRPQANKQSGMTAGDPGLAITYAAFPGERPVISGGRRITGWRETTHHGLAVWVADLPEVRRGEWNFRQLWVNGARRLRPRLPKEGFYRIARLIDAHFEGTWKATVRHGADRFGYAAGDLRPWHNLGDVEVTAPTLWMSVHLRIKELDEPNRIAIFTANSGIRLSDDFTTDGARYYVENVFEALDAPGQWYLDRPAGRLYYAPLPGEQPETAEVIAPALAELVRIEGREPEADRVANLHFAGLTFAHTEWPMPPDHAMFSQSATEVPGAAILRNAVGCHFDRCTFEHLGTAGIEMAANCRDVRVTRCDLRDLGAGGVRIWHGCTRNVVADCEIGPGGLLFPSAAGVVIGRASGNQAVHNHIHHFTYTGISVGWTWGYAESEAYGNIIEYNHIHDIGQGLLSDMAGIYTLGVSPGTRLRYNVIHDVQCHTYGAFGIYLDEGGADILVENNLTYRTQSGGFNQHYGRDNLIRNNIFALSADAQIVHGRGEDHRTLIFEHNIVYFDQGKLLGEGYFGPDWGPAIADFSHNLYWDASERPLDFRGRTFAEWQALGMDAGSVVADPLFVDPQNADFRLRPGSPALTVGFQEFDLTTVGPRGG